MRMDPRALDPHPLIAPFPRWEEGTTEWEAFVEDVQEHGVLDPLWITEDHAFVVDGETRRRAAIAADLDSVPVRVVKDADIEDTVFRNVLKRRNLSQSQRAYILYPPMRAKHARAQAEARTQSRETGKFQPNQSGLTLEVLAESLGVSLRLFHYAAKLHRVFEEREDLRRKFEPTILGDEEAGLGGVWAGVGSILCAEGEAEKFGYDPRGQKPEKLEQQVRLFTGVFTTGLRPKFKYWSAWEPQVREETLRAITPVFKECPDDLLLRLSAKIAWEVKRRQREQTGGYVAVRGGSEDDE